MHDFTTAASDKQSTVAGPNCSTLWARALTDGGDSRHRRVHHLDDTAAKAGSKHGIVAIDMSLGRTTMLCGLEHWARRATADELTL